MRAKRILQFAGAVAALLVLALAGAFSPPVQTWAFRRAIVSLAGPGSSIDGASAGLGRASVTGLRVETEAGILAAPRADAEIGVVAALLGRRYHFKTLVAKGWTLDLTHSPAAGPIGGDGGYPWVAQALGGALAAFKVKADLSLDQVNLEGDVIFPDEAGGQAGRAHVVITGGGVGPDKDGRFLCVATATVVDPSAPLSRVSVNAILTAAMGASGAFTRSELKADVSASGRGFPKGIDLSCTASAARGAGKDSYSVSLIRGSERVAALDAEGPDGSLRMAGSWRLDLRDTDLAPFSLGRSLPVFYAAGQGSFEADPAGGDVHASGNLSVFADRLGVVSRGLGTLGHVDLVADFDFARAGASLRVSRLVMSLSGGAPVASVRALQSFEFNTATGELKVALPADDLVGISIKGVPLAWLKGVLPAIDLGAGYAKGELVMRAEDGRLVLRTRAPLTSEGVALSLSGKPVGSGLSLSAFVLGDYAAQGWQLQLAPLSVRTQGIEMLSLEARFGRLAGTGRAIKAAGSWSASLPLLLSLPAAKGLPKFEAGDASGSFEANLDSTREVNIKVALKGLASSAAPGVALPTVTSEIRADFETGGRTSFSIPAHLDYGMRVVDLVLAGTVTPDTGGTFVDASLSGTRLLADDLAVIAVLSGGGGGGAQTGAPVPVQAGQATAFWPALRGRLALKLEDVLFSRVDLRDVRGTLTVDPAFLSVEGGSATVGSASAAKLEGRLAYAPGTDRPYSFTASVSVDNVDSAPYFRAMNPDSPPVVEGRFDIASHLAGTGSAVRDLLDRVQGDLKLSSKGGSFRALHTDVVDQIKQAPSKLVDALDSVTALFGKKSENLGTALVESAKELSDIHYDQMSLSAARGADLSVRLTEITLIAPEERLSGTGTITFLEATPVQDQPLSVNLDMGVRGHLGKFLDVVGMLKDGQDELGYTQLYQPIHLGGTLRNIDQSQWKDMLVQAPLRKGTGLIDKLLGK